jgi:hypothetical protein
MDMAEGIIMRYHKRLQDPEDFSDPGVDYIVRVTTPGHPRYGREVTVTSRDPHNPDPIGATVYLGWNR